MPDRFWGSEPDRGVRQCTHPLARAEGSPTIVVVVVAAAAMLAVVVDGVKKH